MLRFRAVVASSLLAAASATLAPASRGTTYSRLQGVTVTRASDAMPVELTSLWRKDVALGLGGERAVVCFLRHFGWVFCWELATQLRRDVLPPLESAGVKLIAVGIGSAESASKFAQQTEFPAAMLFADESEAADAYAAAATRNSGRDERGKQVFEGVESMWSAKTNAALEGRGKEDLNAILKVYKPLMPKGRGAMERSFVQGGTFVFDGSRELFAHLDYSSGVHADLEQVVAVATGGRMQLFAS